MMHQVIVVGGGPVGLMCALGLAKQGINVAVLEKNKEISYAPRAIVYAWPIFSGLEYFGVVSDMLAEGEIVDSRSWRVLETGETISYNHDSVRDLTNRPFSLTLGQDLVAKILVKHLNKYPNVTIYWGAEFKDLRQSENGATVYADTDDVREEYSCSWVIGCDGGRSQVRKSLNLSFDGFTWPERFVATDIYYDFHAYGWNSGYLIDPVYGAVIYHLGRENFWRFTYSEDRRLPEESVEERIPEFMSKALPGSDNYDLILFSPYNMHQRSAPTYRKGRVLLAGDAAHVTNPTSGFGLMGGLYDAFSLIEPLAAVENGEVGDEILDEYSRVRRKVYIEVTSPVSTESKRIVFNCDDPERLRWDVSILKWRLSDDAAMRKFMCVPALLETPCLLTGKMLAEKLKDKI